MNGDRPPDFGDELKRALMSERRTQAWLAHAVGVDPGQVSRWVNGKALPHIDTLVRIEDALNVDLRPAFAATAPQYELYLATPTGAVDGAEFAADRAAVGRVVDALSHHVNGVYWPAADLESPADVPPPDIAAEANMRVLAQCSAMLYLQLRAVGQPSGALVELGIALGRRLKTTILVRQGSPIPFMFQSGFQGVAARSPMLPMVRIYTFDTVEDVVRLIGRNGRVLLGLD